jgi:hypothetical protein
MRRLASCLLVLAVGGCALLGPSPEQRAAKVEPMLAAAGFRAIPADTPEKLARLQALKPPVKLTYSIRGGTPHYWYADPYRCKCLYIGDEARYQRYETLRVQADIAETEKATAVMEANAASVDEQMEYFVPSGVEMLWVAP